MLHLKEPKDVPEQHYALLADILNSAWKDLIVTAHEQIKSRFASGNKFFIVYGEPTLVDTKRQKSGSQFLPLVSSEGRNKSEQNLRPSLDKEKLAQEYRIALPEE